MSAYPAFQTLILGRDMGGHGATSFEDKFTYTAYSNSEFRTPADIGDSSVTSGHTT